MYELTREQETVAEALSLAHDRVRVVRAPNVVYLVAERHILRPQERWLRERAWIATEDGDLIDATVPYDIYVERLAESEAIARSIREADAAARRAVPSCMWHPGVPATSRQSGLCDDCRAREQEAHDELRAERRAS